MTRMGNEMGNSNVTGVPEQDSPRIGDVNKLIEVSKDSIDETVQEDQLFELNLNHKAPKEPKAAEEIDNSILQQTCQDREEEEKEITPMEQSPTETEDLKSNEQEEALIIAAQVEDSIQQFGREEWNACSDIEEEEEDSLMTNGEGTELLESLVEDSSTGPTEKIQSGVDMVQLLNGVVVEYDSSSEFDKSQKDEPKKEPEKHEIAAEIEPASSETVILLCNKEGEQDQTEQPIDFDAENESRQLDFDEAMESFYLEAIDFEMRTLCFEANKKEIEIPPETVPDRYYENATVNLEEDSKDNGERILGSLPRNGEEKEVEKNATEVKSSEIITKELENETVIQLTNKEGERDQTEHPIDFDAENESRELDLDEAIESFYLEAIESEMRTECFEAPEKETEIPPETAPDRYYENATVNLEEESQESGERILGSSPQNGEEKEVEKNATEVKSPEIISEELEDENGMIELSGSLTEFVNLSPENNFITKFPELNESGGGELQNSSLTLSDSAADIDAEVLEETQNSDTAIDVTEDTDGSPLDYLNKAQDDNSSVTENLDRKSEESISAFTDLIMEEEIPANPPHPPLELFQELEEKIVLVETEKRDNPERFLSDFHEEEQGHTEISHEQKETEGSLNTESNQENLETERISFDFQNPVPETRFPDVQSTKADFFSSQIFPQTIAVKTETFGVEGSHPDEYEQATKILIAKTEVLTPKATKEERPEEAGLNEKSSSMSNDSAIKRSDAVKSKPPHPKEDDTVLSSLQKHETAAVNKTVDDAWESPEKKIVATSPRMTRKQSKSSLFSSCMCCTTVIQ